MGTKGFTSLYLPFFIYLPAILANMVAFVACKRSRQENLRTNISPRDTDYEVQCILGNFKIQMLAHKYQQESTHQLKTYIDFMHRQEG